MIIQDSECIEIYGRVLPVELIDKFESQILVDIQIHRQDKITAMRYYRRLWGKKEDNIRQYLTSQAREGAKFAASLRSRLLGFDKNQDSTFYLANPNGTPGYLLGRVHFRVPSHGPTPFDYEDYRKKISETVEIENFRLHSSIRHRGFLRLLTGEFYILGFNTAIFSHVFNPGFAFHLARNAEIEDSGIAILSGHTLDDFQIKVSPGPSFAIDVQRWQKRSTPLS